MEHINNYCAFLFYLIIVLFQMTHFLGMLKLTKYGIKKNKFQGKQGVFNGNYSKDMFSY